MALALAGCSPIESWRSFTGVAANDPDPETAPFTKNLAAGEAMDYPNLASVPAPPSRATTTAERQKLTQTLVTERTQNESSAAALLPAGPPSAQPSGSAAAKPTSGAPTQVAAVPTAAPPATPTAPTSETAQLAAETGHRTGRQPAEAPPRESSLQMPEVNGVPEPEKPRPPLPLPNISAPPPIAANTAPPPERVAAAMPAPAPAVPVIADVPPPSVPKPPANRPTATLVAALQVPGTPPRIDGDARAQIERVAGLYKQQAREVRVVAYAAAAAPGAPGGEPLASYHAALERAQTVAGALREAGIPADKVQAEASPASAARPPGRVEIQLMP